MTFFSDRLRDVDTATSFVVGSAKLAFTHRTGIPDELDDRNADGLVKTAAMTHLHQRGQIINLVSYV